MWIEKIMSSQQKYNHHTNAKSKTQLKKRLINAVDVEMKMQKITNIFELEYTSEKIGNIYSDVMIIFQLQTQLDMRRMYYNLIIGLNMKNLDNITDFRNDEVLDSVTVLQDDGGLLANLHHPEEVLKELGKINNEMIYMENQIKMLEQKTKLYANIFFESIYETIYELRNKHIDMILQNLLTVEIKLEEDRKIRMINREKNEERRKKNMLEITKRQRGKLSRCIMDCVTCEGFEENEICVTIHKTQRCKHVTTEEYATEWLRSNINSLTGELEMITLPHLMTKEFIIQGMQSWTVECKLPDYKRDEYNKIIDATTFEKICKTKVKIYEVINRLSTNELRKQYMELLEKGFYLMYRKVILHRNDEYTECVFCVDPVFNGGLGIKCNRDFAFLMEFSPRTLFRAKPETNKKNVCVCLTCERYWCILCKNEYLVEGNMMNRDNKKSHNFLSCAETEELMALNDLTLFRKKQDERFIATFTKKCPKCMVNIEKNDGCNHMNCTHCNTHYCWKCDMIFQNDENMSIVIFNHMEMHFQENF